MPSLFPNVPIVALTATEETKNIISNSLEMVDHVTRTERTYFTLLQDANIEVMIKHRGPPAALHRKAKGFEKEDATYCILFQLRNSWEMLSNC